MTPLGRSRRHRAAEARCFRPPGDPRTDPPGTARRPPTDPLHARQPTSPAEQPRAGPPPQDRRGPRPRHPPPTTCVPRSATRFHRPEPALLPKEYQPILPAQRARVDAGQTDGRRESGATGQVAAPGGADPAEAWIKEWRRLIPPPGVWWRKSAFDLARARRANRLRPWRWLTEPAATFRIWLATGRLSPAERSRWNRRAEVAAGADRLLSALDPYQRRAAACFEDRAMVTAGSRWERSTSSRAGF